MIPQLFDRVGVLVSGTPGTGNATIGGRITSAAAGDWMLPAESGASGTAVRVRYLAVDGNDVECGTNLFNVTTGVLTRTSGGVKWSIEGGVKGTSLINLSSAAKIYFDASVEDMDDEIMRVLLADVTGSNAAFPTRQNPWAALAAINLKADTTYVIELELRITRAAGTTSHNSNLDFSTGTATFDTIQFTTIVSNGNASAISAASLIHNNGATAVTITGANTSSTEELRILVTGIIRTNAAGTFIPAFYYSAAPGGAPTFKLCSKVRIKAIGDDQMTVRN